MIANEAEIRIALGLSSTITEAERAILVMTHGRAESSVAKYLRYNPALGTRAGELYPVADGRDYGNSGRYTSNGTHAIPVGSYGSDQIVIKNIPIRSITKLYVDESARSGTAANAFPESTLLEEGVGFHADYDAAGICRSGIITRIGSPWPAAAGTIKITYESGYSADELGGDFNNAGAVDALPIKTAVIATAAKAFIQLMSLQKKARVGFTSSPITAEKLGDYSYSTDGTLSKLFAGLIVDIPAEAQLELREFVHLGLTYG